MDMAATVERPVMETDVRAWWRAGSLVLVWLFSCLLAVPIWLAPLVHLDQALFRLGAAIMRDGGQLYVDLWDLKQPGIYWFYALAEGLFWRGREGGGVHLLSTLWLATAAAIAAWLVRRVTPGQQLWLLVPLFCLGTQAFSTDAINVAQVEWLLCLPVVAVMALALPSALLGETPPINWFVIGVLLGVVATMKLLLAPVPAAVAVTALALMPAPAGSDWRKRWLSAGLWSSAGFALVAMMVLLSLLPPARLADFLWTSFVYPAMARHDSQQASLWRLAHSLLTLVVITAPLLPLAALALGRSIQVRGADVAPASWRLPPSARALAWCCLTWLVVGMAMAVLQRPSWWAYHFTVFIWPIGLLAVLGIGALAHGQGRLWPRHFLTPFQFFLLCLLCLSVSSRIRGERDVLSVVNEDRRLAELPALSDTLAQLPCRTAYLFGNPVLFEALQLRPATAINGVSAPWFPSAYWKRLPIELAQARPAVIYVEKQLEPLVVEHAPALLGWIESRYQLLLTESDGQGRWFMRTDADCPAPVKFSRPIP